MQLSSNDIQIVKDYFSGQPVLKAYLLGSYSRDKADTNSDIDILVDLDYSKHIGLGFVTMRSELQQRLQKKIDLVSSRGVSKYIKPLQTKTRCWYRKGKIGRNNQTHGRIAYTLADKKAIE